MREDHNSLDVIVVGAGIAGASLAYALGKQGRTVLVIERDLREPDRIVGELLQPGGVQKLKQLGLEECLEGIDAIDVFGYSIIQNGSRMKLPYPAHNNQKVLGRSFHHGRFVQKLRLAAVGISQDNSVKLIQGTASKLLEDESGVIGVSYKDSQDQFQNAFAPLTVVCDGCFSNFRGQHELGKPTIQSHFVGVILENCKLPFPNHGHVFLIDPGPTLGYQIGSNEIRILVDVPNLRPNGCELVDYLKNHTCPQLPNEIRESFLEALSDKKLKSMPNNQLHPNQDKNIKLGVMFVGDAWNMRHPLTGGGMTVALSDVIIIRDLLSPMLNFQNKMQVTKTLTQFYVKRKPMASTINILASALHSVFCPSANDPSVPSGALTTACFDYLALGGNCVKGPMSLLAGLCSRPIVLLYHFFLVAIYGSVKYSWPPTPSNLVSSYRILKAGAHIIIPLMQGEKVLSWFTWFLILLFSKRKVETKIQ